MLSVPAGSGTRTAAPCLPVPAGDHRTFGVTGSATPCWAASILGSPGAQWRPARAPASSPDSGFPPLPRAFPVSAMGGAKRFGARKGQTGRVMVPHLHVRPGRVYQYERWSFRPAPPYLSAPGALSRKLIPLFHYRTDSCSTARTVSSSAGFNHCNATIPSASEATRQRSPHLRMCERPASGRTTSNNSVTASVSSQLRELSRSD